MKISARNQFEGTVLSVHAGPIHTEVAIDIGGGEQIVAVITSGSASRLGLAAGKTAIALVKAPSVTVLADAGAYRFSARNQLKGTVASLTRGAVNSEVGIKLAGGRTVSAIVTNEAVMDLGLSSGKTVSALIKASDVIVAVAVGQ